MQSKSSRGPLVESASVEASVGGSDVSGGGVNVSGGGVNVSGGGVNVSGAEVLVSSDDMSNSGINVSAETVSEDAVSGRSSEVAVLSLQPVANSKTLKIKTSVRRIEQEPKRARDWQDMG